MGSSHIMEAALGRRIDPVNMWGKALALFQVFNLAYLAFLWFLTAIMANIN